MRLILKNLYGWDEPLTMDNWRRADDLIRERADDRSFHHDILDELLIARTGTEIARRGDGEDDDRLQYALEWAFFTRCQWGEFDTALFELERCWGRSYETSPSPIGAGGRPATLHTIRSLADVHAALRSLRRQHSRRQDSVDRHPHFDRHQLPLGFAGRDGGGPGGAARQGRPSAISTPATCTRP